MTAGERIRPQVFFLDGSQLRRLRQQCGLSQQTLADDAGISVTTVARLEGQACAPCRGRTLGRLATALGQYPGAGQQGALASLTGDTTTRT